MLDIAHYGFIGKLTRRLVGDEAYANRQENDIFEDVTEAVTA
jgi:hypothetical protein